MPYSPFDLGDKVAVVTGGNRGIGWGMSEALVQAGAKVAVWATNTESMNSAVTRLEDQGGTAMGCRVDVSSESEVDGALENTLSAFGRVDAVFANAGIGRASASFLEIAEEDYRRVLAVNLDGAYYTLRAIARHMVARAKEGDRGGSLVGVASLAAIEGAARNQHYAATKGALISMIKGCAVEFARYGVRANAILPGWIATDMTQRHQDNDKFVTNVIGRVPARRWGEPADFGGMAVYLTSDASAYQSGTITIIDGGYSVF